MRQVQMKGLKVEEDQKEEGKEHASDYNST